MPGFADWLAALLDTGVSSQKGPPNVTAADRRLAGELLVDAHKFHALDVGGPPLPFDADAAFRAAETMAHACWAVAADGTFTPTIGEPKSAAAHLSADVCLRFLPGVYGRAKPRGSDDPLVKALAAVLTAWPLAGALADLPNAPATPPDFFGHPGLQVLYAERLLDRPRAAWLPSGIALEQAERVFAGVGRPLPVAPSETIA